MLDDQALFDRSGDVVAVGKAADRSLEAVVVGEQPGGRRSGRVRGLAGQGLDAGIGLHGDDVTGRDLVRRTVEALVVDQDVLVDDELTGLGAGRSES